MKLLRIPYQSAATGATREYFVYLPTGYASQAGTWPVMLFLHGNGERGDGLGELDYVLNNGPLYEAWVQKRELPFVIIVPQLPMYGQDEHAAYLKNRDPSKIPQRLEVGTPARPAEFATPSPMVGALEDKDVPGGGYGPPMGWPELEQDLIAMLDHVLAHYRTDPTRQYLTGLSYGGFGTWYLASGHPELMQPIAAAKLPIWCFAGGRDDGVKVKHFYAGLNQLEALGHDGFRFTIEADMGHDTWARVYAGNDVYDWLLAHRTGDVK